MKETYPILCHFTWVVERCPISDLLVRAKDKDDLGRGGQISVATNFRLMLSILFIPSTASVHTLRYFYTSSFQVPNFSKYVSVNDLQIIHYDSDTKKLVPKQEWMNKLTEEDPRYWERNTQRCLENEQAGKGNIETVKRRLNVTGGLCCLQKLYGCEWDNETSEIRGYEQHSFDGEDFISLDFDPETFVAPKQQAFITQLIWERDGEAVRVKHYIIHECAEYLKKYVRHGESALNRIELPLVSLLQKSSSALVTCHATGFYPDRAMLFWTKDGDELLEDVELGEILPNRDGTFQTSVSLDLSSVPPEDWDRYHCAFQLSGDKNKYLNRLDHCMIRNNDHEDRSGTAQRNDVGPSSCGPTACRLIHERLVQRDLGSSRSVTHLCCPLSVSKKNCTALISPVSAALAVVLTAAVLAVVTFILYRRCKAPSEPEVQELNPQPPCHFANQPPSLTPVRRAVQGGGVVRGEALGTLWFLFGALLELAKADKPLMRVTGTGPSPPLDYSGVSALWDFHSSSRAQELSAAPLQSLCRGVIRRALRPSPLEPKVWTLDLPLALKDYLLLSELWPILTVH
ncbi:uncharacterized protein LOC117378079 [Periophthalmus magnuspinnatus]|uniref:uncharacterized protein LOC117378079 n=1 Tax=Periophthalmus magnuspinnatus TaxID=409849 RepID=UPI002436D6E0|nr:uncharacterized protein LOC117378079 [Periophthalmus magnuspinnatus]